MLLTARPCPFTLPYGDVYVSFHVCHDLYPFPFSFSSFWLSCAVVPDASPPSREMMPLNVSTLHRLLLERHCSCSSALEELMDLENRYCVQESMSYQPSGLA